MKRFEVICKKTKGGIIMKKEDLKKSRQFRNNQKYFLSVPANWCVRFDLTPTELFILRHIQYVSKHGKEGCFTGSVKALCSICNCSVPTARKALDRLYDDGWIDKMIAQREFDSGKVADWVQYKSNIDYDVALDSARIEDKLEYVITRRRTLGKEKAMLGR